MVYLISNDIINYGMVGVDICRRIEDLLMVNDKVELRITDIMRKALCSRDDVLSVIGMMELEKIVSIEGRNADIVVLTLGEYGLMFYSEEIRERYRLSYMDNKVLSWRESFDVYLKECKAAYKKYTQDRAFISEQERLNPGIDILLSIEKGFRNFWGTEAGWRYKKKKRIKDIDWKQTIVNSIWINRVYKKKDN